LGSNPEGEGIVHRTIGLTLTIISLTLAAHSIVMAAIAPAQNSAPRVIEVSAKKYEFTPAEIHVKKGERVELKIHSADQTHGIKIDMYPEGPKR
jgi:cytochrome c oxidase subunit 2